MTYTYLTFKTVHDALKLEEHLKGLLDYRLVPVPREISTTCGIALRFDPSDLPLIEKLIAEYQITFGGIYHITKS